MAGMNDDPARAKAATPKTAKAERSGQSMDRVSKGDRHDTVINAAFGLFKGRQDFPQDGLKFQIEVRAEWH
jgi:hypothetical protein